MLVVDSGYDEDGGDSGGGGHRRIALNISAAFASFSKIQEAISNGVKKYS